MKVLISTPGDKSTGIESQNALLDMSDDSFEGHLEAREWFQDDLRTAFRNLWDTTQIVVNFSDE